MAKSAKYYAKGKLLISGEYAVLDGAKALAIPSKFGQWLEIFPNSNPNTFQWESVDVNGKTWLEVSFDPYLNILSSSDTGLANTLQQIFKVVHELNPSFASLCSGTKATTLLEFDRTWGLGSSSTLVHLISQWAAINPYDLLKKTFGGSGYDIACADAMTPIFYQIISGNSKIETAIFNPSFTDKMWFIHLGEKQISSNEIAKYADLKFDRQSVAHQVTELTDRLVASKNILDFTALLNKHEQLISSVLGIPTIKEERFPNISGAFKSLGAWGGDFVLFIGESSELEKIQKLGYSTILTWNQMLINSGH